MSQHRAINYCCYTLEFENAKVFESSKKSHNSTEFSKKNDDFFFIFEDFLIFLAIEMFSDIILIFLIFLKIPIIVLENSLAFKNFLEFFRK